MKTLTSVKLYLTKKQTIYYYEVDGLEFKVVYVRKDLYAYKIFFLPEDLSFDEEIPLGAFTSNMQAKQNIMAFYRVYKRKGIIEAVRLYTSHKK